MTEDTTVNTPEGAFDGMDKTLQGIIALTSTKNPNHMSKAEIMALAATPLANQRQGAANVDLGLGNHYAPTEAHESNLGKKPVPPVPNKSGQVREP